MCCAFVWLAAAYLTYCVGYENYNTKRILLNDQDVTAQIARMEMSIQSLTQHVAQLTADTTKHNSEIESLKAELKAHRDAGYAAGQHYNQQANRFGGPANFLCLPSDPELSNVTLGGGSYIYGTEFEENILKSDSFNEDVPCAVCKSTNTHTSIMIPGRHTCYSGWKMEYSGLLASDHYAYSASTYICVDRDPEYVQGGQEDKMVVFFIQRKQSVVLYHAHHTKMTMPSIVSFVHNKMFSYHYVVLVSKATFLHQ